MRRQADDHFGSEQGQDASEQHSSCFMSPFKAFPLVSEGEIIAWYTLVHFVFLKPKMRLKIKKAAFSHSVIREWKRCLSLLSTRQLELMAY